MKKKPQQVAGELQIVNKSELAQELRVSTRTIENMMAQRIIPFLRISKRNVRFHLPRVLVALQKRENVRYSRARK